MCCADSIGAPTESGGVADRRDSRGSRGSGDYRRAAELLGRKVAATRELRGLTQEQLADLTGIHRNQIQNIERNRNNRKDPVTGLPGPGNARLDTIFVLAEALRVELAWLVDPRDAGLVPPTERLPDDGGTGGP